MTKSSNKQKVQKLTKSTNILSMIQVVSDIMRGLPKARSQQDIVQVFEKSYAVIVGSINGNNVEKV